jgi:TetR/AcrR family transcriptional repressor of bet genes
MARPSNRDERRAQIVDGLLHVLPRTGYERASIQLIAEAAGLGAGLVHHHFGSKLEILLALGERLAELVQARTRRATTPRTRVDAWIDAHLALGPDAAPEAVACWVALGAEALVQPEVGALYRTLIERRRATLDTLLRDVCRDEARTTRGLDVVTASILATVEGFFLLATVAPDVIPRGSAAGAARTLAHQLLDARPSRAPDDAPPTRRTTPDDDASSRPAAQTPDVAQSPRARKTKPARKGASS